MLEKWQQARSRLLWCFSSRYSINVGSVGSRKTFLIPTHIPSVNGHPPAKLHLSFWMDLPSFYIQEAKSTTHKKSQSSGCFLHSIGRVNGIFQILLYMQVKFQGFCSPTHKKSWEILHHEKKSQPCLTRERDFWVTTFLQHVQAQVGLDENPQLLNIQAAHQGYEN